DGCNWAITRWFARRVRSHRDSLHATLHAGNQPSRLLLADFRQYYWYQKRQAPASTPSVVFVHARGLRMSCIAASVLRGRTKGSTTPLSPDTTTSAPRNRRQKRPGSCQQESLQPRDSLPAEYVSMDYRVPVSIPCWWCPDCQQHVMPDFILAGCFPSSPQRPSLLFSLTLMKALTVFQSGRLSMTVFASGIHAAHRPYELFLDPTDQPIKAELLTEAHCNWLRATNRVTHLDNLLPGVELSGGPFADCPCCAGTEQTAEDGYHRCACADGVTKLSSYAGVGRATADLQPHLTSHLDHSSEGLEGDVQHRFLTNALSLPNLMADAGGPSVNTEQPGCSTSLTCCRPEVNKSVGPPVSIHGLIGFCCSHGVPLLGMFCNMRTPEQFAYYLLALAILMNFCTEFYIDFGCRLKITWARYVDAMGYPSEWKDARILVNWMHGASHDQRCQIINNGRFQPRAGWRYGEQCEQLWSMMKDLAGVTRYMTLAHRADVLQSRLSQIALSKATGMLELLNKQLATIEQAGVFNGRQASDAYKASCLPASQPRATDAWKGCEEWGVCPCPTRGCAASC
ncbi:uncharacterized protein HaLaN_25158, partial [Haematococcus lacustris]